MRSPVLAIPRIQNGNKTSSENFVILKDRKRRREKHRGKQPVEEKREPEVKEFVQEDIYLMDNRSRRLNVNLLAKSITSRLKKSIPEDVNVNQIALNKLRRESLRDIVHLDNLNKQYTNEMNWQSNRLDNESFQIIKRHNYMKKQSESQRQNQEKMESKMRSRSGMSSVTLLPRLLESSTSTVAPSPAYKEAEKTNFPEYSGIDLEDTSNVKVFKLRGTFQPQNKYRTKYNISMPQKTSKPALNEREREVSNVTIVEADSPIDLPQKSRMSRVSRKGFRVTWSSQSRFYSIDDDDDNLSETNSNKTQSRADTRSEMVSTPSTIRSIKSDSYLLRRPSFSKGRSKIETIGLRWKLPPGHKQMKMSTSTGGVSHNLMPVTTAINKEGWQPEHTRWQVQKVQSVNATHMYKAWLQKLEQLKRHDNPITTAVKQTRAISQPV